MSEASELNGISGFPVTTWGLIRQVRDQDPAARHEALESLCRRYWKPAYQYIRAAWSTPHEDAKDLTQAFFLHLIEGDLLARYVPGRGGFRSYLKTILRHVTIDQHHALKALKRGGGARILPLDHPDVQLQDPCADSRDGDPDRLFDAAWKRAILERAIERTRQRFDTPALRRRFRVFELYDLGAEGDPSTYAQLARRMDLAEHDVRNYLSEVREHLRDEVRAEIAQTVSDPEELDAEWKALFEDRGGAPAPKAPGRPEAGTTS
jgi:RNA polymerase sigma-70 factor (ECF subfamily)